MRRARTSPSACGVRSFSITTCLWQQLVRAFRHEHLHHHATVGIVKGGTTAGAWPGVVVLLLSERHLFVPKFPWRIERRRQLAACAPLIANVYVQSGF